MDKALNFDFNIITKSQYFEDLKNYMLKYGYIRDVTKIELTKNSILNKYDYLKVVQKSPLWFQLRSESSGTASVIGKYIKGQSRYPTSEQIYQAWLDKINQVPFNKTVTMAGHMKWGVSYEDPAILHFCQATGYGVASVGTVKVRLSWMKKLGKRLLGREYTDLIDKLGINDDHYFLISPDGLVYRNESNNSNTSESIKNNFDKIPDRKDIVGFLEIKCASPFHHCSSIESDQCLNWVADIEDRQWHNPANIPPVYNLQMAMQTIAGCSIFAMPLDSKIWLQRWTPNGFSLFESTFKPFVETGLWGSILYLYLYQNIKQTSDLEKINYPFEFNCDIKDKPFIAKIQQKFYESYKTMSDSQVYSYYKLDCYPEFNQYNVDTRDSIFKAPGDSNDIEVTAPDWSTVNEKAPNSINSLVKLTSYKLDCLID